MKIKDHESEKENFDAMPSPTGAKMLGVIECLAAHPEGRSAPEMVKELGLTTNLTYRLLKTLAERDWIQKREDGNGFVLTNKILNLAGPTVEEQSLSLIANTPLRRLRDEIKETVQLLIPVEGKMCVLEQFRGVHALQVSGRIGMRVPMYSCAPGKAVLAAWGEETLKDWFLTKGRALKSYTPQTLSRKTDLKNDLEKIRVLGYALDLGEGIEGINCVAVVIRDRFQQPVGAITTMGPVSRVNEENMEALAFRLTEARDEIEAKLQG